MGLRADIQTDVAAAFDADLADAVQSFSGTREVSGEYDPTAGTSITTVAYSGRGVFGSFRQDEIDGQHIIATDTKLTALQNEVTKDSDGSKYAPEVNDDIGGKTVVAVQQDPSSATWALALRKT